MKQHVFALERNGFGEYYSDCYHLPVEPIRIKNERWLHPYEAVLELDGKLVELLIEGESSGVKVTAFWPNEETPEGSDDYEDYECLTYWNVDSLEEATEFVEGLIHKYYGKIDEIYSVLEDEGFGY